MEEEKKKKKKEKRNKKEKEGVGILVTSIQIFKYFIAPRIARKDCANANPLCGCAIKRKKKGMND